MRPNPVVLQFSIFACDKQSEDGMVGGHAKADTLSGGNVGWIGPLCSNRASHIAHVQSLDIETQ